MKKNRLWPLFLALLIGSFTAILGDSFGSEESLVVIANASVSTTHITSQELADYYLKRKRFWPDGTPVRLIDWTEGQPARKVFLSRVLKRSESDLAQYWMGQKLSTGDQPPMSLDSGDTICNLVSTLKGSLGYFLASSETLKTCSGVKQIGSVD